MNKAFTRSLLLFSSIMLSGLSMAATSSDAVYRPMFEIGKTWKYTLCDFQYIFQPIPDLNWELRIDDIVVEDGKEYFVMNAYVDNFDNPVEGGPYALFREDPETRQVWVKNLNIDLYPVYPMITSSDICQRDEEVLLYDFAEPEHSYLWEMMSYLPPVSKESFTYETLDGELHTSYHYDDKYDKFMLVEGLGILPISDKCTGDCDDPIAGDLTGFILFLTGNSQGGVPYLYEVDAPDGTVLYACESKRYKPEDRYFYFVDYYREWHYRLVDCNPSIDPSEGIFRKPDIDLVLKCDTDDLVGDKYYWVVNAYIDGSETPLGNRPYVYLCEDWFDKGKVWARIPDDQVALPYVTEFSCSEVGEDVLLYDFTDITNSAILRYSYFGESQSESDFIKRDYIAADGFHHTCFQHKDRSDIIFVDGFGMLPAEEQATSYNTAPYPGDFLGMVPLPDGIGEHYVPYLYEITDKGRTIYRNDYCGEMTGIEDVDASENVDWQIGSDYVTIGSSRPIGEVKVTSLSGMVVRSVTTGAQSYTVNLNEMPAGIYVISAAGTARKVVVR